MEMVIVVSLVELLRVAVGDFVFYNYFENSGKMASGIYIKGVNVSRNDQRRS